MNHTLNIAENIVHLRHKRKITQEQLADFVGVTKASVSKWETRQNTPDITLLPRLAAFFDVTVDELIGYQPQLSKEQIQKLYQEFALDFSRRPFDEVMERTQAYVKRYYSCDSFLFQICVLWLNHHMLADSEEKRHAVLTSISELCTHIRANCENMKISNDTLALQATVSLQLGKPQDVIDSLEDTLKPYNLINQSGTLLTQAYMMTGNTDKAVSFTQISIYNALLSLVGTGAQYISMQMNSFPVCEETIDRIEQVTSAFNLAELHPNNMAIFEYQAALCCLMHKENKKALEHIRSYISCLYELFSSFDHLLHGDDYFNKIENWFQELDGGSTAPRDKRVVLADCLQSFQNPAFDILKDDPEFQKLEKKLKEIKL